MAKSSDIGKTGEHGLPYLYRKRVPRFPSLSQSTLAKGVADPPVGTKDEFGNPVTCRRYLPPKWSWVDKCKLIDPKVYSLAPHGGEEMYLAPVQNLAFNPDIPSTTNDFLEENFYDYDGKGCCQSRCCSMKKAERGSNDRVHWQMTRLNNLNVESTQK